MFGVFDMLELLDVWDSLVCPICRLWTQAWNPFEHSRQMNEACGVEWCKLSSIVWKRIVQQKQRLNTDMF